LGQVLLELLFLIEKKPSLPKRQELKKWLQAAMNFSYSTFVFDTYIRH
jgi:hypothetical protein